jgi:hypothetical protein
MTSTIKNIFSLVLIAGLLVLAYIFFVQKNENGPALVSLFGNSSSPNESDQNLANTKNFISLLLNIKDIRLEDSVFSGQVFSSLKDSSIILTSDGNEGRSNPFAPIEVVNTESKKETTPIEISDLSVEQNPVPAKETKLDKKTQAKKTPETIKTLESSIDELIKDIEENKETTTN